MIRIGVLLAGLSTLPGCSLDKVPDAQAALRAGYACFGNHDFTFEQFAQAFAVKDQGKTWLVFLTKYGRKTMDGIEPWGGPASEIQKNNGACDEVQLN